MQDQNNPIPVVLGVDIGGTNTRLGLIDQNGTVHHLHEFLTTRHTTIHSFIEKLQTTTHTWTLNTDRIALKIIGIGVGAPAADFYRQQITHSANLPQAWNKDVPLTALLQKKFALPVIMDNDANCAVLGEMLFGAGKNHKNFVIITLGTGIGCGIVANGKILRGSYGQAGEFGHIIVIPDGRSHPRLKPKSAGSLECYVSNHGLLTTYDELCKKQLSKSTIPNQKTKRPMSATDIALLAQAGDQIALDTFMNAANILGLALTNLVHILNPECIIFSGGISNAFDLLNSPLQKALDRHLLPEFLKHKPKLITSQVDRQNVGLLGAAALFFTETSKTMR